MELFENYLYTEEEITAKIANILAAGRSQIDRKAVLRTILSLIDLTALNGNDTEDVITLLCEKALSFADTAKNIPSVAAVCVYPPFVNVTKRLLSETNIRVASVAGCFPSGQSPLFVKLSEIAYAIEQGADEIDMVISRGKFLEGKYAETGGEIAAIKAVCGGIHLKVILETGELKTIANIRKASEIALLSGGDFIKTSTGKSEPAATLQAAWVIMETVREFYEKTGQKAGFKPAGGISDPDAAIDYYLIAKHILGEKWLNSEFFRFGASRLADKIYDELTEKNR